MAQTITGATQIAKDLASTTGRFYIGKTNEKKIWELVPSDLYLMGKFSEGTFAFEGEEPTTTQLRVEDGEVEYVAVKQGTYGIKANFRNLSTAVLKFLMKANDIDVTSTEAALIWTGFLKDYESIAMGSQIPTLEGYIFMVEFLSGTAFDIMTIPLATITSQLSGSGSADNTVDITMKIQAVGLSDTDVPADLIGQSILLSKKTPTP